MQVILISECTKAALTETRRILDQFAERRGERTWQTTITLEGLKTLRRLLRRSARKNTAVACHWVRGVNQTELLWTVGKSRHFNDKGAVPTNSTQKDMLRLTDENDWHTGELIYLLSSFGSLLHDLGKACDAFQLRLQNRPHHDGVNIYRHEWVSVRLFQAFVGGRNDAQWLKLMLETGGGDPQSWLNNLERDGLDESVSLPFETLPPLAAAIAWLVLSHHRLPDTYEKGVIPQPTALEAYFSQISSDNNQKTPTDSTKAQITPYWTFSEGLPVVNQLWQKRARRLARQLLALCTQKSPLQVLDNAYVMHLSRLSLMLADHHYSSLSSADRRIACISDTKLYANTREGRFNQTLEEHLVGVAMEAGHITHGLPSLERSLPSLANHRGLRKRTQLARFRWQDRAFDLVHSIREKAQDQGAFFVNMASTGCGKTLANARIMYALAEPDQGARFTVALGLRTLTIQTGEAYRAHRMHLDDDQLAIRVGGAASKELYEFYRKKAEQTGSESFQDLMDEDGGVLFEGDFDHHPLLQRTLHNRSVKALISAPVLVCTVDHLTPATEAVRGGRQIAPMLRLMTSDLVLDEIDDYGLEDLPALARLVHWAALLGARVMLSSATLPPALVQGLFAAYYAGRKQYQENRGIYGANVNICTAWFDEHDNAYAESANEQEFMQHHLAFAQGRKQRLEKKVKDKYFQRSARIIPVSHVSAPDEKLFASWTAVLLESALELHADNSTVDPGTGKAVSFGLIRMANIDPLVHSALELFKAKVPENYRLHLGVYHSQYPLIMRSAIEYELDQSLNRSAPDAVFDWGTVRQKLDTHTEENHLFIVLASPVAEVGRDHDYDWAIVEPSSMRSIIQLAGRVRRHRPEHWERVNIHLLSRNIRSLRHPGAPAFQKPGFEDHRIKLKSHELAELLEKDEWQHIDSRPRILARQELNPATSLVDLEHEQLARQLLPRQAPKPPRRRRARASKESTAATDLFGAHVWWSTKRATLMALLQRFFPFRFNRQKNEEYVFLIDDESEEIEFCRIDGEKKSASIYVPVQDSLLQHVEDKELESERVSPWFEKDYMRLIEEQAQAENIDLSFCSKKYGVVSLYEQSGRWHFHPFLGFFKPISGKGGR